MLKGLRVTDRQRQAQAFVMRFLQDNGRKPTLAETAQALNLSSRSVGYISRLLERTGTITEVDLLRKRVAELEARLASQGLAA